MVKSLAGTMIGLVLLLVFFELSFEPAYSSYSFWSNVLDCNSSHDCRHEIGHKMDDDLGMPSLTEEFGRDVQVYLVYQMMVAETPDPLASLIFMHPGVWTYDKNHTFLIQRELYASIYVWADGDVTKLPEIFQKHYTTDRSYLDLYDCLTRVAGINVCGTSISNLWVPQ